MSELVVWSAASRGWHKCAPDEITWLDRSLLSAGRDLTLHRSPRCPGLRHVHHRWELFSRDISHLVYAAPSAPGTVPGHREVEAAARFVLPLAHGAFEPTPARLDAGAWAISVGTWVLPVRVSVTPGDRDRPTSPGADNLPGTYEIHRPGQPARRSPPVPDAVPRVARYFQRNPMACLAMAFYYQDFISGGLGPQPRPMDSVIIALDLNKGAISEYKKELQRHIWNEQGHQRELGEFLLVNGLVGAADLGRALQAATANESAGRTGLARERLRYNKK